MPRLKPKFEILNLPVISFQSLKKEWQLTTDNSLKDLSEELAVRHQAELNEMKRTWTAEVEELKGRLESLSLEKEHAKSRC